MKEITDYEYLDFDEKLYSLVMEYIPQDSQLGEYTKFYDLRDMLIRLINEIRKES